MFLFLYLFFLAGGGGGGGGEVKGWTLVASILLVLLSGVLLGVSFDEGLWGGWFGAVWRFPLAPGSASTSGAI